MLHRRLCSFLFFHCAMSETLLRQRETRVLPVSERNCSENFFLEENSFPLSSQCRWRTQTESFARFFFPLNSRKFLKNSMPKVQEKENRWKPVCDEEIMNLSYVNNWVVRSRWRNSRSKSHCTLLRASLRSTLVYNLQMNSKNFLFCRCLNEGGFYRCTYY